MLLSIPSAPSLGHYIRNSLFIHLGLLLFIIIFSLVKGFFVNNQRKTNILLVKSSVRVDVVAMPRMTLKELQNAGVDIDMKVGKEIVAENIPPPPAPPVKSDSPEFKVKKKEIALKDILKKYSGKKRVEKARQPSKEKKKVSSLKRVGKKKLQQLILAGNRLSKGNALTGGGGTEIQSQFQEYASRFPDWVRPHWNLPGYLINRNLKCRIRIFVSATGELIKVKVIDSSGDDEYDRKAVTAIENSSPFPPPSDMVRARVVKGDIVLGFPL